MKKDANPTAQPGMNQEQMVQPQNVPSAKPEETIVHNISVDENNPDDMPMKNVIIIFVLVVVVGILSGFGTSYLTSASGGDKKATNTKGSEKSLSGKDDVIESAGIADKDAFSDSAEGKLEEKTEDDFLEEGSFKLIRPGGDSQTVHLTSSTVDMSEFTGKTVRVYGETFASEKVGWLMDVGFIEVIK